MSVTEAAIGISIVVFSQYFGSALFSSFADTIFTNNLKSSLRVFAPNVDAQIVIHAGASRVRDVVPAALIHGVLLAYNHAVVQTFVSIFGNGTGSLVSDWLTRFPVPDNRSRHRDVHCVLGNGMERRWKGLKPVRLKLDSDVVFKKEAVHVITFPQYHRRKI